SYPAPRTRRDTTGRGPKGQRSPGSGFQPGPDTRRGPENAELAIVAGRPGIASWGVARVAACGFVPALGLRGGHLGVGAKPQAARVCAYPSVRSGGPGIRTGG